MSHDCSTGVAVELWPRPKGVAFYYRVKKIYTEIGSLCGRDLENWINGFERELYVEQEIIIWERILKLYKEEMKLRHAVSFKNRNRLFHTLRLASQGYNSNEIINQMPELKKLPFFERVVNKY